MKLLQKSDITKAKSADRQREIAEGSKLAERVDALREVAAQEDASLKKFRTETLTQITKEILVETNKRDSLTSEVTELEERKKSALIPLTEEWEDLKKAQSSLLEERGSLSNWRFELDAKDTEINSRSLEVERQENRANDMYARAEKLLQDADESMKIAIAKTGFADNVLSNATQEASRKIADATQREEWVKAREEASFKKEEELRTKEIELAKEWSKLKDREATLERNIKRLK